ncbi:hypothetical protein [Pseudomonas aeruginosa]|uniref:hypothetical protein n=1 Tax=Pseudomonas aeruginosa TaxID=287 RepID=UPI00053DE05C|nr:hypothetical protein [Pseudomonas aeruginosa]
MSSTQHQLIEQCLTRLRGIVEALDNIHDSAPHRWSTDLDDVHSSAESLLASSLKRHAPESNLVARATNYLAAKGLAGTPLRDSPALVEQAGGDERAAFEAWATHLPMDRQYLRPDLYMPPTQWAWEAWQARAALAQPSPTLPPFAEKVLAKLRRFYDCAGDFESGGVDIGRHWLDLLTQLGLLNRVQRSPALWEISQQGDDLLEGQAAQAGQMPQAWLDVQAERRRQVTAEGWTPEHDDAHSYGQMARAACYALAGSSAPNDGTAALLVSLAWPWDEQWWKPSTARRDMVKACALGLAEIERLDRVAASQGGPSDA